VARLGEAHPTGILTQLPLRYYGLGNLNAG
jgi:hypothetical protein